jgi:hypothetical protein
MAGAILNGAAFRPIFLYQPIAEIESQLKAFRPQILMTHMLLGNPFHRVQALLELLWNLKKLWDMKVVVHMGDPRMEIRYPQAIDPAVDFALLNHKLTDLFSSVWRVPCYHWPYFTFTQSEIASPVDQLRTELLFTGRLRLVDPLHMHYGRCEFVKAIKEKLNVTVFPNEEISDTRFMTPELSAGAEAVLGISFGANVEGYVDTRPFQYIGAGAVFMHDVVPGIKQFFVPGEHFIPYATREVGDVVDKFQDRASYGDIRRRGFEYCQRYHTEQIRMRYVIDLAMGREPEKIQYLEG